MKPIMRPIIVASGLAIDWAIDAYRAMADCELLAAHRCMIEPFASAGCGASDFMADDTRYIYAAASLADSKFLVDRAERARFAVIGLKAMGLWRDDCAAHERGPIWGPESLVNWMVLDHSPPLKMTIARLRDIKDRVHKATELYRQANEMMAGWKLPNHVAVTPLGRGKIIADMHRLTKIPMNMLYRRTGTA